jgi:hypothetical protein
MGEVYRARDTRLGRDVAIKVLPEQVSHDQAALARFDREARTVAALSHPHIAALFEIGEHEGTHYLAMERLEGETLASRLRPGALPAKDALHVPYWVDRLDLATRVLTRPPRPLPHRRPPALRRGSTGGCTWCRWSMRASRAPALTQL